MGRHDTGVFFLGKLKEYESECRSLCAWLGRMTCFVEERCTNKSRLFFVRRSPREMMVIGNERKRVESDRSITACRVLNNGRGYRVERNEMK